MISFEQAIKKIVSHTSRLLIKEIPVERAVGYVLAEDIYSKISMPPFNKSAMDGYAVDYRDVLNTPVNLKRIGCVQAGKVFKGKVARGECVKIMTGAPVPEGTDSVVMVENTKESNSIVEISKGVKKGENVCFRGEDIKEGIRVLKKDMCISSSHVSILAAVGCKDIKVYRKPKISVLNTGEEIVAAGNPLPRYKIYNSNGPLYLGILCEDKLESEYLGIAKDEKNDLERKIQQGLKSDILIISGGVSMGDYDLVPDVLKRVGVNELFHGVRTKPGRPLFFGKIQNTLVFGVPGNPTSNFLTYYIYIKPAILKMMGNKDCSPCFKEGILVKRFMHRSNRKHFVLVKIRNKNSQYELTPLSCHGSADIGALSKADGFMIADESNRVIEADSKVRFFTWKNYI